MTVYLGGLRNRLSERGVRVLTVLPGFIRTKMIADLPTPAALTAEPTEVADDVYKAYRKQREILYTKFYWKWIMLIIKMIPERIFKRMNI